MVSVGIDVGGTGVKGVRLGDDGAVVEQAESPTTADDPDALVETIIAQARQLGAAPGIPLGIAVAAFVDPTRRVVQFSPNISWSQRALADEVEQALGVGVVLENDANAACFGEYRQGAGRGAHALAMFTLGTGVGGAIMESGRTLVGSSGIAGELGHIPIVAHGRRCGCGLFGCLETIASGTAIVSRVRELTGRVEASSDEVTDLLRADSGLRNDVFEAVADALTHAILTLRAVVNPDTVIIGGGVMERSGDALLRVLIQGVSDRLDEAFFPATPRVVGATLGNRAGAVGAALLAAEQASSTL